MKTFLSVLWLMSVVALVMSGIWYLSLIDPLIGYILGGMLFLVVSIYFTIIAINHLGKVFWADFDDS